VNADHGLGCGGVVGRDEREDRGARVQDQRGGRSGWNVVTSGDAGAAGNFSRDEHYDYDTRYARGLEFVRVAQGLWNSYEAAAFPRDRQARRFLDPSRLHALNHKGEHFQVAGPLNISRSPQGQPVIFQAGDSEQGRDLGATIGEGIFTHAASIEQGQAFYSDLKARQEGARQDEEASPGELSAARS
jgi:alkanesulfonate monooxygenase SsuD/methylene tetrahydromethanopterin reductase-like flavin-dependent oxidoreductase (luciferase family)